MDHVYIVRHHFKGNGIVETPDNGDDPSFDAQDADDFKGLRNTENSKNIEKNINVSEWIYRTFDSAFDHAVELSLSIMGIDRHNLLDLDEVRMFKELTIVFKEEKDKPYKAIKVPCDTGKEELEEDLIEFHKVELLE